MVSDLRSLRMIDMDGLGPPLPSAGIAWRRNVHSAQNTRAWRQPPGILNLGRPPIPQALAVPAPVPRHQHPRFHADPLRDHHRRHQWPRRQELPDRRLERIHGRPPWRPWMRSSRSRAARRRRCARLRAERRDGQAGTGPGSPAGSAPYRFTDTPGACGCPDCDECPCYSQHVSGICACCRVGLHDHTCDPFRSTPGKSGSEAPVAGERVARVPSALRFVSRLAAASSTDSARSLGAWNFSCRRWPGFFCRLRCPPLTVSVYTAGRWAQEKRLPARLHQSPSPHTSQTRTDIDPSTPEANHEFAAHTR
jgi:hypothetical protein